GGRVPASFPTRRSSDLVGTVTQSGSQSGTWSWSGTGDEDSPYTVTITATNADGSSSTVTFDVSFTDVAPTVSANSPSVSAPEDQDRKSTRPNSSHYPTS